MKTALFAAAGLFVVSQAMAKDDPNRWVTFRTGHDTYGAIAYQLDRNSIRRQGPYFTFETRAWVERLKQPVTITVNEALFFWTQTYAVDCARHKFGAQFIDTNMPSEARHKASLATMRWEDLAKVPAVAGAVCARP
jgi:hypothetical protein